MQQVSLGSELVRAKNEDQYQRVHIRPSNLHPIFSFEKMGAFVGRVESNLIFFRVAT